jgi:uncharacterized MnhB-related membrane protein
MSIVIFTLTFIMLAAAVCAVIFKDLMASLIASMLVSLLVSVLFVFLQAPDVAMTEAAVGAGLTTAIFAIAIRKTSAKEEDK